MIYILISMTLWGSIGAFVLWSHVSMFEVVFYRCLIGFVVLFGYGFFSKKINIKFLFNKKNFICIFGSSIFLVSNWIFLFYSFKYSSITLGNMCYYLQPIFLIILGMIFFKEKVSLLNWIFIIFSLIGVVLTSGINIFSLSEAYHNNYYYFIGIIFALLAGLLYAMLTISVKPLKNINSFNLTLIQLFFATIILIPFFIYHHAHYNSVYTFSGVAILIIIGVVHTALACMLYYKGVVACNVKTIGILSYVDPVIAVLSDVIFFNNSFTLLQILGILITLLSSYFVINIR